MKTEIGAATGWGLILLVFALFEAGAYYFCPIPFLKALLIGVFSLSMAFFLFDGIRVFRGRDY